MTIFESLAAEVDNLRRSPRVRVRYSKNKLVRRDGIRDDVRQFLAFDVPPLFVETVDFEDNMHVYWSAADNPEDAPGVFGEFFMVSVLLLPDKNDLDPIYQSREYAAIPDMRDMRVFDYYAYNGGPIYSLLQVKQGRLGDEVFVFDERDVFRTSLSYDRYLQMLCLTRGFLMWQYLFCKGARVEQYDIESIERGLAFIEREFPHDDYSELRDRLNRVKSLRG
jgi:hypothetical protein